MPFVIAAESHTADLAARRHVDVVYLLRKYVPQNIVPDREPGWQVPGEFLVDEDKFAIQFGTNKFEGKFAADLAIRESGEAEPFFDVKRQLRAVDEILQGDIALARNCGDPQLCIMGVQAMNDLNGVARRTALHR